MGARDISKTLVLKDGVSGTLNRVGAGTVRHKKQLADLKRQGDQTWSSMKKGIAGVAAAIGGFVGMRALISLAVESADAATVQGEAEKKLAVIMRQTMSANNDMIQSVKELADAQEKLGVVAYDAQISGAQELSTYLEKGESLKNLLPVLNDLVAQQYGVSSSVEQVTGMATMLGKVMDGQTGALRRYGFTFSEAEEKILKFGEESERVALLTEIVRGSLGDMNHELGKTDAGKIKQATDTIAGLKVLLGNTVLFIKAQFSRAFMDNLPEIQAGVQGVADGIRQWAENGGIQRVVDGAFAIWRGLKSVWKVAVVTFDFFRDNWSLIGPIVYGIVGAIIAYKGALVVMRAWTMLVTAATFVQTAAQLGLNVAIRANPLGFLITLIGLAITAGIYLAQNWETVKLVGMNTWNVIVDAAEWGVNALIGISNFVIRAFVYAWDSIEFAGKSIWNGIIIAGEIGVNGFISLVEQMINGAIDGINRLARSVNDASEFLGFGKAVGELNAVSLGRVDFSGALATTTAPVWDSDYNAIGDVDFGGAKFSDDSIAAQARKAQDERNKKKASSDEKLISALEENTAATGANTGATDENTGATNKNTSTLKGNQSAMDIADGLLGRIERHLYAT